MKYSILIAIFMLSINASASPAGDCSGTPKSAIVELPEPLRNWGQLACTPYGHIITNKEGWVWSNPGSYSPIMIPSQMVRSKPKPLGNKSYFTKIEILFVNLII